MPVDAAAEDTQAHFLPREEHGEITTKADNRLCFTYSSDTGTRTVTRGRSETRSNQSNE